MSSAVEIGGTTTLTSPATEAEARPRTRPDGPDPVNDWLCAWCLNRVASERDRLEHHGQSEFLFKNPDGLLFHIITFSRAPGCRPMGAPTLAHTWFAGHAWSYCLCSRCRRHLGWFYTGPTEFVGLIRDRITRALLMLS